MMIETTFLDPDGQFLAQQHLAVPPAPGDYFRTVDRQRWRVIRLEWVQWLGSDSSSPRLEVTLDRP